jgi:hypothetical protein
VPSRAGSLIFLFVLLYRVRIPPDLPPFRRRTKKDEV